MGQSSIVKKILTKAGNENLIQELSNRLSQSEISNLLLALLKELTAQSSPQDLLRRYASNRFVKPSKLDPLEVKRAGLNMLETAANLGFSPLLLSPASPLGSCSVIAEVDQNHVLSAVHGSEIIADSTNMLALYLADGIKNKTIDNSKESVHVCTDCRVMRAQMFPGSVFVPHFAMLVLVSCGKDAGSYVFEKDAIARHLAFYKTYFADMLRHPLEVFLNQRGGYSDPDGFMDRIHSHLVESYPRLNISVDRHAPDNQYYKGLNFKMSVRGVDIIDGGFVDWTQKLLGSKKERLFTSASGIDMQFLTGLLG